MSEDEPEAWREALPFLERGLDQLKERDRELLLGRFFEGKTFKQLARDGNGTEAACKMRIRRSLDRLNQWMGKNGITLSAATVSTGLSLAWPKSAPAAAVESLSSNAVASASAVGSGTLLTNSLCTMSSFKAAGLAAGIVLGLGAIALTLQHLEAEKLSGEVALLRNQIHRQSTAVRAAQPEYETPAGRMLARAALPRDPAELAEILMTATMEQDLAGIIRLMVAIHRLSPAEIETLLPAIEASEASGDAKSAAIRMLVGFVDPDDSDTGRTLDIAMEFEKSLHGVYEKARRWAERDPRAALAWYLERRDDGRYASTPKGIAADGVNNHLLGVLLPAIAKSEPEAAVELLGEITDRSLLHTRQAVVGSLLGRGTGEDLELSRQVMLSIAHQGRRFDTFKGALYAGSPDLPFEDLVGFGESLEFEPRKRTAMLAHIAGAKPDVSIEERGNWLAAQLEPQDAIWISHFINFGTRWDEETLAWADSLPAGPLSDHAQSGLVLKMSKIGQRHLVREAVNRARSIADDELRATTLRLVVRQFHNVSENAPPASTPREAEEFSRILREESAR